EKAKEAVFKSKDSRMIMVYYQGKVKYFEYIKDYKNAYLFALEELKLSREVTDERHKSVLAKLNSSYKIQQKNILLEKELEERKAATRLVIFILITILLVSGGLYLIFLYKKKYFSYLRLEKKTSSIEKKLSISDKERKKFQSVFEYSVTGILILDKNGIIQYGNRKSKELLGQKNIGDHHSNIAFTELFSGSYKKKVQKYIYKAFEKPQKNDGFKVQTISRKNLHWLNISFAPLYFSQEEHSILVSLIDVTQEVINIKKEQEQKRELQTLINSVTESILFIQVDGRIKASNLTAANRLATEIDQLIGSNYFDSIPQLLLERRRAMFNKVVLTKMPLIETEMEANYNYLVSMYPNINAGGEVDYISEFVQDITEKRIAEEEIDKLKQRVFRSQMNPHFIFNSLTSIQSFILSNNVDSASKYLNSFARLIRLILESSRLDYISLKNEIDILTYYLDIQKMRFADNFNYDFYVDPEIEVERVKIPPMLAQPFIENAIEHGIQHLDVMGEIDLKFIQEGKFLFFELLDNGIGRAAALSLNKDNVYVPNSLATQIINDRIKAINKYAKEEISYKIIDLKDTHGHAVGTHVIIKIPLSRF
ncbi:MAG: histidine kinase, partial [Bacteroidales bacterium]|nr:histidine kinase [Bacteroidales bacterium]